MWECKYCGHKTNDDNLQECPNCGTGKDWKPPADVQAFNQEVPEAPATSAVPIDTAMTTFLRLAGMALALFGIMAGIMILSNAPAAPASTVPLYGDPLPTQIQSATRTVYLVLGWAQIIGGVTGGVLLYTVACIGDAVRDLWKAQFPDS
ncbi:MAG: hypothetical protein QOD28_3551 [Acidobacteriota bacterium]|nr:hypothetical protein [Acidobacteriota bacterium]